VRYRIDQDSHTVVVLDVSHRSDTYRARAISARRWELAALSADCKLVTAG
jgi:hypothetical protein